MVDVSDAALSAAKQRWETERAQRPIPKSVRFDRPSGRVLVEFTNGAAFMVPARALQGLEDATVRTVSFMHSVPSPDDLWRGMLGGTVRTSALVLHQPDEMQRQIRTAFDRIVQQYTVDDHLELPVSVKLATARKP